MNADGEAFVEQKNKQRVPIFHRIIDFVDLGSRSKTLGESNNHRGAVDPQKNIVVDCKAKKVKKARVGDVHNNTIHEKVCTEQFVLFWDLRPFWTYNLN